MRIFYRVLRIVLYSFFSLFTPKKNIILIQYDKNDSYGNISILYEKMKGAPDVYKICGTSQNIIEEVKNIYLVAGSRVIAVDTSSPYVSQIQHSSKTDIIFIGHGGGAYKKMAFAALSPDAVQKEKRRTKRVSGKYTYVLCTSESIKYQIASNYNIKISNTLPFGLPRTDAYYKLDTIHEKKIFFERTHISKEKKLILYAPTFRTKGTHRILPKLIDESLFPENFYDKYCILFRIHPAIPLPALPPSWIDVTNFSLSHILAISDILISDFSSIIFDYSFFKRPILLFIPDEKKYQQVERTLWYSPQELVGNSSCCYNTKDILKALDNLAPSLLWNKQMDACNGDCCTKISQFLFSLLGGKQK